MAFLGVDQFAYPDEQPGSARMAWLRAAGFQVTGFYLGPTLGGGHPDGSWMPHRAELAAAGWGFLPDYVGRQAGSPNLSAQVGGEDAQDAASLMRAAGFPQGSVVFLDIESADPLSPDFMTYLNAWASGTMAAGFTPGVYCFHGLLTSVKAATPFVWTYHYPPGVAGTSYDPAAIPNGQPDGGAIATQYLIEVYLNGYAPPPNIGLDFDICVSADPSAPSS